MSNKTKKLPKTSEKLANLTANIGILILSAATTFGMIELPDHSRGQILLPSRPAFAFANENENPGQNNSIRRENEETIPHYISYSVSQRTPSRSGKR